MLYTSLFNNNSKFTETLNSLNVTLKEISTRIENLEDKMVNEHE